MHVEGEEVAHTHSYVRKVRTLVSFEISLVAGNTRLGRSRDSVAETKHWPQASKVKRDKPYQVQGRAEETQRAAERCMATCIQEI